MFKQRRFNGFLFTSSLLSASLVKISFINTESESVVSKQIISLLSGPCFENFGKFCCNFRFCLSANLFSRQNIDSNQVNVDFWSQLTQTFAAIWLLFLIFVRKFRRFSAAIWHLRFEILLQFVIHVQILITETLKLNFFYFFLVLFFELRCIFRIWFLSFISSVSFSL